jgi:hypothetical protein
MTQNRYKPVGWRYESYRHSLAARGMTKKSLVPISKDATKDLVTNPTFINKTIRDTKANIMDQISKNPELLAGYQQEGIITGISYNHETGEVEDIDVSREKMYEAMGLSPKDILGLRVAAEQRQNLKPSQRPKGGRTIPELYGMSDEQYYDQIANAPASIREDFILQNSRAIEAGYLDNALSTLGLSRRDLEPNRFRLLSENDQRRIIRMLVPKYREAKLGELSDEKGYRELRAISLERADEERGGLEMGAEPVIPYVGDIKLIAGKEEADREIERLQNKIYSGKDLTRSEENYLNGLMSYKVDVEEGRRISDLAVYNEQESKALKEVLDESVKKGQIPQDVADELMVTVGGQVEAIVGPYKEQLKDIQGKRAAAAEAIKQSAKEYRSFGRVKDMGDIVSDIEGLKGKSDQDFMSDYSRIKGNIISKQNMLSKEVADDLKRRLEAVKDVRQLGMGLSTEATQAAMKQQRTQRLIAGRAGKARSNVRFKIPAPGTPEREEFIQRLIKILRRRTR